MQKGSPNVSNLLPKEKAKRRPAVAIFWESADAKWRGTCTPVEVQMFHGLFDSPICRYKLLSTYLFCYWHRLCIMSVHDAVHVSVCDLGLRFDKQCHA